jgi:hypothetical protein
LKTERLAGQSPGNINVKKTKKPSATHVTSAREREGGRDGGTERETEGEGEQE